MTREEIFALFDRREAPWRSARRGSACRRPRPRRRRHQPDRRRARGRARHRAYLPRLVHGFFRLRLHRRGPAGRRRPRRAARAASPAAIRASSSECRPTGRRIDVAVRVLLPLQNDLDRHERRILDFTGLLVQVGVLRAKPAG